MDQAEEVVGQVIEEVIPPGETPAEFTPAPDEEEVVITIGGPPPEALEEAKEAPQWVRDLRKADREKARLLREKDEEIAKLKGKTAPDEIVVGERPAIADFEFDETAHNNALDAWYARKTAVEAKKREVEAAQAAEVSEWEAQVAAHNKAKTVLKVADYEDAEASALEIFSQTQQGIIVTGATNSAIVIYALGKSPAKAKELAAIKNPVKFAFAVAKLEEKMNVTPRKAPPPPEKPLQGNASVSNSDPKLAKLEAEADRTGDRTAVAAYRREQRAKAA
jgi:hypothetical protein